MRLIWLRRVVFALVVFLFIYSLIAIVVTGPVVLQPPRVDMGVEPSPARMRADVERLCTAFGTRHHTEIAELDAAADWIAAELAAAGLTVEIQPYTLHEGTFRNVIAVREGSDPAAGLLVVGAHYDAYGRMPGADDNASGVAVLLELARTFPAKRPRHTQHLVFFSTEEPPFFGTDDMGSAVYARSLAELEVAVDLMVALDGVGYFSDAPGSQRFPVPGMSWMYDGEADFIAVVGDLRSGRAIQQAKRAMMATTTLPIHSFRAPAAMQGVHWSDHLPFREAGIDAVLLTDTLFMRGVDYHGPGDLPDTLDYERMAGVVLGLHGLLRD